MARQVFRSGRRRVDHLVASSRTDGLPSNRTVRSPAVPLMAGGDARSVGPSQPVQCGMTEERVPTSTRREADTAIAVVVVAYEAESTVRSVLEQIPQEVNGVPLTVLVSDDASLDQTFNESLAVSARRPELSWEVVRRPVNLGYGGNQKECYRWALKTDANMVVLLHGDGQYDPALIGSLIAPLLSGAADAVLGSRMSTRGAAKEGGMPVSRRWGNRVLSTVQNRLTGQRFSEWHSGYRAYSTDCLRTAELESLPNGFDFDTALMLRLIESGHQFAEVPIPTRYADEKSRVNLALFGLQVLGRTVVFRTRGRHRGARGPAAGRQSIDPSVTSAR